MAREFLTDEQVEIEIAQLNESEAVRLARLEQRVKYKRRQYLYTLRQLENRGRKLISEGITAERLKQEETDMYAEAK